MTDNISTAPKSAPAQTKTKKAFSIIVKLLKFIVPIAVSVLLVLWLFHRVDFHEVMRIVREGVDFGYIVIMMLLTMLSFIIRGIRWGIQLRGVGIPPISPVTESVSIFGAYAMNLLFPFLGEAWRCVFMARRTHTPLTTIVGTDVGDRISDAVIILLLIILTLIVANPAMMRFLDHYSVGRDITHVLKDPYVWGGIVLVIGLFWSLFHWWGNLRLIKKMKGGMDKIWEGFVVLFHLKGIGMYIILSFAIWICYFFEMYSCFYAFPFTRELIYAPGMYAGFVPALVAFVFGSISVAVPSNGGLGPWNIAVMFALSLYGLSDAQSTAFSMVYWSCQTAMIILLGLFSLVYIMRTRTPARNLATAKNGEDK